MIQIAICDDDKVLTQQLYGIVYEINKDYTIDIYEDGKGLLAAKKCYDVIFLDVDMPVLNGIDTAKEIRKCDKKVRIIYVTSYTEYMHYAFEVHAFAYMLKPITKEQVETQLIEISNYDTVEQPAQPLRFETQSGVEELDSKDIFYFEYVARKVRLVTKKGEFTIREGIHALYEQVERFGFYMPHKSFIVNLYQVKVIKGYDIVMMNGSVVPLSQKKSVQFRNRLSGFHGNQI